MAKRRVFYSFYYDQDVMRVQQIRNIGVIEGNSTVTANRWEEIKNTGDNAVKKWIDDNMENKSCLVVLVGDGTANRKWVKYEIKKAWESGKGVMGIHIHNLKCPVNGCSAKGENPFEQFQVNKKNMSEIVPCHNPVKDAYNTIAQNIEDWIEEAIAIRRNF